MASYELWMNGQQYDSIFYDGHEYTEAWTSINGVPTLVWKKGGGILAGGFYDANDNQLLDWFTVYDGTRKYTYKDIKFTIPHWTNYETQSSNTCNYLARTMYELPMYSPPDIGEVSKIVVPSEVTQFTGVDSYGVFYGEYSTFKKLKEIVFNGTSPVVFSVDSNRSIITNCHYLEKVVFPPSTLNQRITYYCGDATDEGTEIDLSKTTITNLVGNCFYNSKIKTLILPETITTIEQYAFYYATINCKVYLPNVKIYPDMGYPNISEMEIPEGSTLKNSFASYNSCIIGKLTINNGTLLEPYAINSCEIDEIRFVGNNFVFYHNAITLSSISTENVNIIFDDSIEIFNRHSSSDKTSSLFNFSSCKGLNLHLPNSLKKISSNDFYISGSEDYQMKPLDIPSSVELIESWAFCPGHAFTDKVVVRNPNITVERGAFDHDLSENCTLYFDGENANDWIGTSGGVSYTWKEILPVSAYEG